MTYLWQGIAGALQGTYRGVLIAGILCTASHGLKLVLAERGSLTREVSIRTYRKVMPLFFIIVAITYGLRALLLAFV